MTGPRFYSFPTVPGVTDDGSAKAFHEGDYWWNSAGLVLYICASAAPGAAVWYAVGGTITIGGTSTNQTFSLAPKGTGVVRVATHSGLSGVVNKVTVTNDATAGAVTYTAAQIKGGIITRDPAGGNRTDVLPTAALLVAAIPGAAVGDSFDFVIKNTADMAETITVQSGAGGTDFGDLAIAQNETKRFRIVLTNVTAAAEAYSTYNMGVFSHNT